MKGKRKQVATRSHVATIGEKWITLAYLIIILGILGSTSSVLIFVVGDAGITAAGSMLTEAVDTVNDLKDILGDLETRLTEAKSSLETAVERLNETVTMTNSTMESLYDFFSSSTTALNDTAAVFDILADNIWLNTFAPNATAAAEDAAILVREMAENISVMTPTIETAYNSIYELTEDVESTVDSLNQILWTISVRAGSLVRTLDDVLPTLNAARAITIAEPLGMLRIGLNGVVIYLLVIHIALILIGVLLWRILSSLQKPI